MDRSCSMLVRIVVVTLLVPCWSAVAHQDQQPHGFTPLFDGTTLNGWKGLVGNPKTRSAMSPVELVEAQAEADRAIAQHWRAEAGEIVNDGHGPHLCTDSEYRDFELLLDWKISPGADSGIYLRGAPQVQIWDPLHGIEAARVGSGGLYNNQHHRSTPLLVADRPAGTWNTFYIRMIGERVTVMLNGQLVVDDVVMENYWDRGRPIYSKGQIELQTHGGEIRFRNLYIREIATAEANLRLMQRATGDFASLFNGRDLEGWTGSVDGYVVNDNKLVCDPARGGNLFTHREYGDFVMQFEFRLPPGGNNGLAIRAPLQGNPAYDGIELQILDNTHPKYAELQPYQYHGSVYGVTASHRGYLRPVGEWNMQEVRAQGSRITVTLNGTTIVDVDLESIAQPADGNAHPGMHRARGHVGFMGHGDAVAFRNLRIRELAD